MGYATDFISQIYEKIYKKSHNLYLKIYHTTDIDTDYVIMGCELPYNLFSFGPQQTLAPRERY